ncbi:2-hydroxyacid dehydrogenase [Rhodobacteraceae bacterium 2CG4]|uniref:2-hydroxyacid dehydrogenase n=1 Tax=Halovulum marinum TaxID=2662447 RepID=A0A6L5YXQ8_9RHOB|nr:2-hydroxyacid dehydrogenase [Halovulum marinum]MSU88769.1 2-hydroxyacid dehydrogenase [Halovulum marinum]
MTKPDVLLIGDYPDWDTEALAAAYTVHRGAPEALGADLATRIRAVAFKGHAPFGAGQMDALPGLGLIANFGVGYDAVDVEAATARGIRVTNTPDVLTDDVADLAVGMLLAATRHMVQADAWVRQRRWATEGTYPLLRKASGKRAGIVGLGRIGRAIADRLAAFDMPISYTSRAPKDVPAGWTHYTDPAEMAAQVDYLVVALAGGPETAGLVTRQALEALGPEGMLVNISRGTTVDEEAMIALLQSRKLGAAALDVFLNEPDPDPRLLELDNVLLQPHQASATVETRQAMGQLQRDNLAAFFADRPLKTPVN